MKFPNLKLKIEKTSLAVKSPLSPIKTSSVTISQLTLTIFLSCYRIASNEETIKSYGVTHVVNCAADSLFTAPSDRTKVLKLAIRDNNEQALIFYVFKVIDFMRDAEENGGKVLIHCKEGISRSPFIAAAYLMWKNGYSKQEAISLIKAKRQSSDIKLAFLIFLDGWQKIIRAEPEKVVYWYNKGKVETLFSMPNESEELECLEVNAQIVILEPENTDECDYFVALVKKYCPVAQLIY